MEREGEAKYISNTFLEKRLGFYVCVPLATVPRHD